MFFKKKFKFTSLFFSLLVFNYANAVEHRSVRIDYAGNAYYSGPVDAAAFAGTINVWGNRGHTNLCSNQTLDYSVGRIDRTALVPYTGRSMDSTASAQSQYFFESGIQGLAYYFRMPVSSFTETTTDALTPGVSTVFKGSMSNERRLTAFPTYTWTQLTKDAGKILDGVTEVPAQDLYKFECYDTSGILQEVITMHQPSYLFTTRVTSCAPAQNMHTIQMRDLKLEDVENAAVGTIFETVRRTFSLICDANIDIYQTINDLVDPTNFTNISTLTSDSTAKGIGYQVLSGTTNNVYSFSSPGSTPGLGTRNQYYIDRSNSDRQSISHDLRFSYIKTDNEVSEGTVKSIIGITYSYQ